MTFLLRLVLFAGQYWQSVKAYSGSVGLSYMAAQSRDCEETDAVKALASLSVGVLSSKRYSAWIQTHTVKNPTSILYIDANSPRSLLTCAFHTSLQPPWWANGTWQRLHVRKPNQSPRRTFRSLRSPVLSYEHEGDTFSKPLSPDLLHTYAGQLRHNAEPLQTRRFEHLNHSAKASSTTCSWVTFWNLTKEQYKLISISLLMSSYWHWTVCVCILSGPQPCYHKPLRIRPKIRSGLELWFLLEHQQLFLLPYLCLNTNIRGKLQIINSFCHIASHIRLELSGMKNNAEQNYCIPAGKGVHAWWTRCKRSTMKKWAPSLRNKI